MMRPLGVLACLALLLGASPATAQDYVDGLTPTPVIAPTGGRYVLMVLDQADSDLTKSRTKVNVLLDNRTGKTWILQWGVMPNSNQRGYVWSEIPFAVPPK